MTAFDYWNENCVTDGNPKTYEEFARIAFNAGMTRAAEICRECADNERYSYGTASIAADAIEKARDGE